MASLLATLAGEGAVAGLAIGASFGAWELYLNADLAHGMFRLAALRALGAVL